MLVRAFIAAVSLLIPTAAVAQVPTDDCVAAFDATGTRIGRVTTAGAESAIPFDVGSGNVFAFEVRANGFVEGTILYYSDPSCSSPPLLVASFKGRTLGGTGYFFDPSALAPTPVQSLDNGGGCQSTSQTVNAAPAQQFALPALTPPLHLEAEDCQITTVSSFTPMSLLAMCVLLGVGGVILRASSEKKSTALDSGAT
jgi:hypothetical protein